jgi:glutaconyl-CoA/methylmalonyl-CoA decarboxylase subunit gamma
MKYIVKINDNSYEVEVEKGEARLIKTDAAPAVAVIAKAAAAPVEAPVMKPAAAPAPAAAPMGAGEKISSPMPGVILQIKKSAGDSIKKGDIVFILEAMKMENEILAPFDGVISQITTVNGASVNTGDILAVMQ